MTKKEQAINAVKQERTIKVKTLLIAIAFIAVALSSFIGGWFIRSDFDSTVREQVNTQVQKLNEVSTASKASN